QRVKTTLQTFAFVAANDDDPDRLFCCHLRSSLPPALIGLIGCVVVDDSDMHPFLGRRGSPCVHMQPRATTVMLPYPRSRGETASGAQIRSRMCEPLRSAVPRAKGV